MCSSDLGAGVSDFNYVYFSASDGRVYALSPKYGADGSSPGEAWGGEWAGGAWIYDSEIGENPLTETALSATGSDIQFELVNYDFGKRTVEGNPEPTDTTSTSVLTAPADWDTTEWIVRRDMKLVNSSGISGATPLII